MNKSIKNLISGLILSTLVALSVQNLNAELRYYKPTVSTFCKKDKRQEQDNMRKLDKIDKKKTEEAILNLTSAWKNKAQNNSKISPTNLVIILMILTGSGVGGYYLHNSKVITPTNPTAFNCTNTTITEYIKVPGNCINKIETKCPVCNITEYKQPTVKECAKNVRENGTYTEKSGCFFGKD
ncbi:MAG: hypothetical protein SZ59_C0004G0032 [candidate division TM6 bacterium GW2011_GWF2_28_16]|nr:MAG: hypothetical protein SZ59_C0004G0032 [candidate division TM6 bacterium GW2011_GWF2_28_16]